MSPTNPGRVGDQASETGDLDRDLDEQTTNLDRGVAAMPLDAAASSVARWKGALGKLKVAVLDAVTTSLDELSAALAGGAPDGRKIGTILARLGQQVHEVAGRQSGTVALGLRTLSRSLIGQGTKLGGTLAGAAGTAPGGDI